MEALAESTRRLFQASIHHWSSIDRSIRQTTAKHALMNLSSSWTKNRATSGAARRLMLLALLVAGCHGSTGISTDGAGLDSGADPGDSAGYGSDASAEGGAGAGSCLAVGDANLTYTTSAVCDGNGTFGAVQSNGCCSRMIPAVGDIAVSLDGPGYQGPLQPCEDVDPVAGFDIMVEVQRSQVVPSGEGFFRTVVDAARLDRSPSCGHRLIVTSYAEHLSVAVGAVFEVRQSTVVYPSAQDLDRGTTIISSPTGAIVLISSIGSTPPDIDAALLPDLGLSVDTAPVCRWGDEGGFLLRVHITDGSSDCALDSGTQRCCNLMGTTMEVRVQGAGLVAGRNPDVLVNATLRQPGLFVADSR